jgi:hypothetical protein
VVLALVHRVPANPAQVTLGGLGPRLKPQSAQSTNRRYR